MAYTSMHAQSKQEPSQKLKTQKCKLHLFHQYQHLQ